MERPVGRAEAIPRELALVPVGVDHRDRADGVELRALVRGEIEAYGNGLAEKPEIVALSKADALDAETLKSQVAKLKRAAGRAPLVLSSASRKVPDFVRPSTRELSWSTRASTSLRSASVAAKAPGFSTSVKPGRAASLSKTAA